MVCSKILGWVIDCTTTIINIDIWDGLQRKDEKEREKEKRVGSRLRVSGY